jgi:hypothetical protein
MATNAQIGSKTVVSYFNTGTSAYEEFAECDSIDGIGLKRPEVDVTHLESDAVERIGGLPDGETVTLMFNMVAENFLIVKGLVDAGDLVQMKIDFPAPLEDSIFFDIIPLEYKIQKVDPKGALKLSLGGRITGDISEDEPAHT